MTKLPVVSGKELIKYLSSKGFVVKRVVGDHAFLRNDGLTTTVPLHKELDVGTLKGILEDVGIEREQFIQDWHS